MRSAIRFAAWCWRASGSPRCGQISGKPSNGRPVPKGLSLIDGQAGTGKSYTMAAIREAYEASGRSVIGLAPTNAVAQDMLRDGFRHAGTVHSELFALKNGRRAVGRPHRRHGGRGRHDRHQAHGGINPARQSSRRQADPGRRRPAAFEHRSRRDVWRAEGPLRRRRAHRGDPPAQGRGTPRGHDDGGGKFRGRAGDLSGQRGDPLDQDARPGARRTGRAVGEGQHGARPDKSRFVFAYTNADVAQLNADLRAVRRQRGELGEDHELPTADGQQRLRRRRSGSVHRHRQEARALQRCRRHRDSDRRTPSSRCSSTARGGRCRTFDAAEFQGFRHGYAGTIYKGQGRTLDQTYLYHSEHWRSAASYVALTRHRDKAELFVATNTARDVTQLARQMARVDDRRAASQFHDVAQQRRPPADGSPERHPDPTSGQHRPVTGSDGGQVAARYQEARARAADARQARSNSEGRETDRGREDDRSR